MRTLVQEGYRAIAAGKRSQSYDLEVLENPFWHRDSFPEEPEPGRYEVKALSPRKDRHGRRTGSYDTRFKVGRRGTVMYGRHDALTKAAALELERSFLHDAACLVHEAHPELTEDGALDTVFRILEDAFQDRHSVRFRTAFEALCRGVRLRSEGYFMPATDAYLAGKLTGADILRGYGDISGIFVICGDTYTLVKRDKIPELLSFQSKGAEGVSLRFLGVVPSQKSEGLSGKRER